MTIKQPTGTSNSERQRAPKRLLGIATGAALTLMAATVPAQAAVIDQVKSRVDAIKNDTNVLKSRANQTIQRLDETASTVNSVIAETDIIKGALAPLANVKNIKDRFTEFNFDPADLLDNPAVADAIAKVQEHKAKVDELINDPDVATFRTELLVLLAQVKDLAYDGPEFGGDSSAPEPMVTLVENAPPLVIAVLKAGLGDALQPITTLVSELSTAKATLSDLMQDHALGTNYCAPYTAQAEVIWVNSMRGQKKATLVNKLLSKAADKLPELPPQEIGIHGYVSFEVDISEETGEKIQKVADVFENLSDKFELVRETADHCTP